MIDKIRCWLLGHCVLILKQKEDGATLILTLFCTRCTEIWSIVYDREKESSDDTSD